MKAKLKTGRPLAQQDLVYQHIRKMILEGGLFPKDLSRRKLAAALGVSSVTVQLVLGRLEGERLLESKPQSGTFLRQVEMEEYENHFDIREQLEPYGVERAASRITAEQMRRLRTSNEIFASLLRFWREKNTTPAEAAQARDKGVHAEHLFHGTIMEAAQNPTAAHFIENLRALWYSRMLLGENSREFHVQRAQVVLEEHTAIYRALRVRNVKKAKALMFAHLRNGRIYLDRYGQTVRKEEPEILRTHVGD